VNLIFKSLQRTDRKLLITLYVNSVHDAFLKMIYSKWFLSTPSYSMINDVLAKSIRSEEIT